MDKNEHNLSETEVLKMLKAVQVFQFELCCKRVITAEVVVSPSYILNIPNLYCTVAC